MSRKSKVKKKAEWPCGICAKNCEDMDCLWCGACQKWLHIGCEEVDKQTFKTMATSSEEYICTTCRNDDGNFDFLMGMARLKKVYIIIIFSYFFPYIDIYYIERSD